MLHRGKLQKNCPEKSQLKTTKEASGFVVNKLSLNYTIHTTPLETLAYQGSTLTLSLDDTEEIRRTILFSPYQYFHVITDDCIDKDWLNSFYSGTGIYEAKNSALLLDLKHRLKVNDFRANFLEKSRHFIIPLQDNLIEIVAWDMLCKD